MPLRRFRVAIQIKEETIESIFVVEENRRFIKKGGTKSTTFTTEEEKCGAIEGGLEEVYFPFGRRDGGTVDGWRRENRKTIQVAKKERVRDRGEERARRRSGNGPRTHQGRE